MAQTCSCTNVCQGESGPTFPTIDRNGNIIQQASNVACKKKIKGYPTTPQSFTCTTFQLTKMRDAAVIDRYANEALTIGGADINFYKLLGVHEQGQLVDVTGKGAPISGGDLASFPKTYAFDIYQTKWKSVQTGSAAILASSYIGYDFGPIKIDTDERRMYGITANIYKHITAIKIKQSDNDNERVTRVRIERSQDGQIWYGAAVAVLPDNNCLNTIYFKSSVPSRYWRIRPLDFTGDATNRWVIQALELYEDYEKTHENNIQDMIFLENRDRSYSTDPLTVKAYYDLIDTQTELSKFGIELPSQSFYTTVSFSACVAILGRPPIIGDIVELPSEAQFNIRLERIKKYLEISDVAWSLEGYTPSWQPTMLRLILQPAYASQETQDLFGDLSQDLDPTGLSDINNGDHPIFQDYSDVSQTIQVEAKKKVPEKGAEGSSNIHEFSEEELDNAAAQNVAGLGKIGLNSRGTYVEDAMPPNNKPFTEGPEFPTNPSDKDYHRITYEGLAKDVPARLYRWSSAKGRWVFLEKDKRAQFDPTKPTLQEFLTSDHRVPNNSVTEND